MKYNRDKGGGIINNRLKMIISIFCTFILFIVTSCANMSSNIDIEDIESIMMEDKIALIMATPNYNARMKGDIFEHYELLHSDIDIQLTDYSGSIRGTDSRRLFNTKLNLDILSGKQIDLIDVSTINLDKYIEKSYFLELNDLMEQDYRFQMENYFPKVMESIRYGNSYYYMPRAIHPILYYVNKEESKDFNWQIDNQSISWDDFYNNITLLEQSGENNYVFTEQAHEYFILNLIKVNLDFYTTEDGFVELDPLIPKLKELEKNKRVIHPYAIDLVSSNKAGKVILEPGYGLDPEILTALKMRMETREVSFISPPNLSAEQELYPFTISEPYAICVNTAFPEETWLLLKYLITVRIPLVLDPLSNRLLNFSEMEGEYYSHRVDQYDRRFRLVPKVTEEEYQDILELYDNLNYLVTMSADLESMIMGEIISYTSGIISMEEMIQQVENKINLYMNE
ncbi:extracellular solute-binding protein [Vallitalea okinawensis]|uniref:extracellular solute-binding protein n=1 Tax=Vallitalea okinawensis TaxID=2078660 RepID=UPI0014791DDC|nr:extracellular solute-binding protein [Vallitalea okinawensis]